MPNRHRITGLPKGTIDTQKHEIQFELAVSEGPPLAFVAKYGPAGQVISALARMHSQLRQVLRAEKGSEMTSAEEVSTVEVQKEQWSDTILVQLVTAQGVPHLFALSSKGASDMADSLKTESARKHRIGSA